MKADRLHRTKREDSQATAPAKIPRRADTDAIHLQTLAAAVDEGAAHLRIIFSEHFKRSQIRRTHTSAVLDLDSPEVPEAVDHEVNCTARLGAPIRVRHLALRNRSKRAGALRNEPLQRRAQLFSC